MMQDAAVPEMPTDEEVSMAASDEAPIDADESASDSEILSEIDAEISKEGIPEV